MNYTYAQLKQMQEDASRRVMEMRQRADVAAGQSDEDMALDLPLQTAPAKPPAGKKAEDENERALILALMALLEAEKADKGLLLALAYVLD